MNGLITPLRAAKLAAEVPQEVYLEWCATEAVYNACLAQTEASDRDIPDDLLRAIQGCILDEPGPYEGEACLLQLILRYTVVETANQWIDIKRQKGEDATSHDFQAAVDESIPEDEWVLGRLFHVAERKLENYAALYQISKVMPDAYERLRA